MIDAFIYWSKFVGYLIFRKENIYIYEKEYRAVKAAKRGNDIYSWRLRKRLKHLYAQPRNEYLNNKDRSRCSSSRLFLLL